MSFIYRIANLNLSNWRKAEEINKTNRHDIAAFVSAAIEIRETLPEFSDWRGEGEYWLAPLPLQNKFFVIVRPNANPFAGGILVSPINIPDIEKEQDYAALLT